MNTLYKRPISRREFLKAGIGAVPLILSAPSLAAILAPASVRRSTYVMGSIATIEAYGSDEKLLHHAITKAFDELHRLDAMMTVFNASSALSAINRQAGKGIVETSPEILEVISTAREVNQWTEGSFDITVEPLMQLWGFRNLKPYLQRFPCDAEIARRIEAVGYHNLELTDRHVGLLHPESKIDLGGIAVGYALDRAASILDREGVSQALINHSGDIIALDAPPLTDGWICAIPNPSDPQELLQEFNICRQAVSTSGSYEKYVEIGGKRLGHIMTPATGKPSELLLSTTIVSNRSVMADAFSTALFAMSPSKAAAIAGQSIHVDSCFLIEASPDDLQIVKVK